MVRGYHVIFCAYEFWLPNDPRGSWSDFVGAWELLRFGKATKTNSRQSVAQQFHNTGLRLEAKNALKYPPGHLTGLQARAIGSGFGDFVRRSGVIVWACPILPEHVHLEIARHNYPVEEIINLLKGAATRQLVLEQVHPLADWKTRTGRMPKCWARGQWKVFLENEADIRRAIRYVEQNPVEEGKPTQRWSFVTRFQPDQYV